MAFNLLIETNDQQSFNYIVEEGNKDQPSRVYIEGPYMVAEQINKNKRYYVKEEMEKEVRRYTDEMITAQRAMGELNHPTTAEVDLERACHIVTKLEKNGNEYIGRSKILSTPCGKIVENLIRDGVKVGMSTRSLGKLEQETGGIHRVKDMKLVAIDCVADPSYTGAFVDGILESKQWICDHSGKFCELYEKLEKDVSVLPTKHSDDKLKTAISQFFKSL
jgi:hypothetical protein